MNRGSDILRQLEESPEDWGIRILAIEERIRVGDSDGAKLLVRESPAHVATPPEIQVRIHALMTQGLSEVAETETDFHEEPAVEIEDRGDTSSQGRPAGPEPTDSEWEGGLSALIEREECSGSLDFSNTVGESDQEPGGWDEDEPESVQGQEYTVERPEPPQIDWELATHRWDDYDGELNLVDSDIPIVSRVDPSPADRVSSLTLAIVVHLILFVFVGFVAVTVPTPKPPQIVVTVPHERETEITATRLVRPAPVIQPSAASARPVDLLSSTAPSSFSIPEVDNSDNLLVTSMVTGLQDIGRGMDFSSDTDRASDIMFFGISGSARKVTFIIDATPYMLVDAKGGMTAYNKVKDEVGIMLANLNRGTQFNLLLYDGKQIVAFRNELVPALPSNLRMAIEWLDPLNRSYEALGLRWQYEGSLPVKDYEDFPIQTIDLAHYSKAIHKALEWGTTSIFCIASGFRSLDRSPTEEMLKKMEEDPYDWGEVDPREAEKWREAVAETREWLQKENAERRRRNIDPKVVTNFNALVREVTGMRRPQRTGGTPGGNPYRLADYSADEIEDHIREVVRQEYKEQGIDEPSLHMVLFLGEDERVDDSHFRSLTRRNRGKLKVLRGLAALDNVTGR
ncbi:MAG: hypothetical protein AAGA96_12320 [Verrucomicrobiota bacterium]